MALVNAFGDVALDATLQSLRDEIGAISANPTANTVQERLQGIKTALDAINANTDGLEGFTDGLESLLTSIASNTDQLEGYTDQLEGYTDQLETLIASTNSLLANGSQRTGVLDSSGNAITTDNRLPVDIGGNASVTLNGDVNVTFAAVISTANSTSTPLASNATFTGTWEEVLDYASISAIYLTDANSATDGAKVQWSADGVNVLMEETGTVYANIPGFSTFQPKARYMRVVYTNGSAAQTVLRAQIVLRFQQMDPNSPLATPTTDLTQVEPTKAHLAARHSSGAWLPIATDGAGGLQITDGGGAISIDDNGSTVSVDDGGGSLTVDGSVSVSNFPATQPISASALPLPTGAATSAKQDTGNTSLASIDGKLASDTDGSLKVADVFTGGEALASQNGANGVLTFTFAAARDLIWIRSVGGISYADPFGGTPASGAGIYLAADEPTPITVRATSVKVYAPSGATVYCWGYSG